MRFDFGSIFSVFGSNTSLPDYSTEQKQQMNDVINFAYSLGFGAQLGLRNHSDVAGQFSKSLELLKDELSEEVYNIYASIIKFNPILIAENQVNSYDGHDDL